MLYRNEKGQIESSYTTAYCICSDEIGTEILLPYLGTSKVIACNASEDEINKWANILLRTYLSDSIKSGLSIPPECTEAQENETLVTVRSRGSVYNDIIC